MVQVLTTSAGPMYYDAPHPPREEFTIRVKSDGAYVSVTCDEEPGLCLVGDDLTKCLADFEVSVKTLRALNGRLGAA